MKSIQKGHVVSKGIGIGRAFIYKQYTPHIQLEMINPVEIEKELEAYEKTKNQAHLEIAKVKRFLEEKNDEKAKIFDAHLEILNDIMVVEKISKQINEMHYSYRYAIKNVYDEFIELISQVDDLLIRERVLDLKDVRNRLLRISEGIAESDLSLLNQPSVIVAHDLYPSDTATIDRKNVQAILTEVGGVTSHTAIIAKSYEIPAILGIDYLLKEIKDNEWMIVDANHGNIIINPDMDTIENYKNKQKDYLFKKEISEKYIGVKSVTKDGIKIEVTLNIGSASTEELENEPYVDGIGLFRTEFLYMENTQMPNENQQFEVYKKTLVSFKQKPVILRTLDIGGDKELSYLEMPNEVNPFLGNRAIRLCFDHMDMFKTQLRAALRASVFGNLWLMFPMVGSMDDIYRIKSIIEEVKVELTKQKIQYNPAFKIGVMIEIPSIIMIADHVAEEVDFASIGTNDLCQYMTAVDRMNPNVSQYFQNYSPSMFRVIKMAIDAFDKVKKPISICGESGGDLIAAPVLIGLGMRRLSMNKSSIASIKQLIITHTIEELEELAIHVISLKTEKQVIDYINSRIKIEE
ncbi:MAG: phosphoenolpyruvate--protein phosphotransferase [Firmicutes bacterium]|nr:phosphoenolpyruvate--protein phosphotransferase [Bacillota bacterium]